MNNGTPSYSQTMLQTPLSLDAYKI